MNPILAFLLFNALKRDDSAAPPGAPAWPGPASPPPPAPPAPGPARHVRARNPHARPPQQRPQAPQQRPATRADAPPPPERVMPPPSTPARHPAARTSRDERTRRARAHRAARRSPAARPSDRPAQPAQPTPAPSGSLAQRAAQELSAALAAGTPMTREWVAVRQWALDKLDPDGVPGDVTHAKAEEVMQQSLPWNDVADLRGGIPTFADPQVNAEALWRYVHTWNGQRPERIAAYQHALGIDAIGTVGPKTRARVKELTGLDW